MHLRDKKGREGNKYLPQFDDIEHNLDYLELVEKVAIIPPALSPGTKFDTTSARVQLLN